MGHHVTVHQLESKTGKSFINVRDNGYNYLEVWGSVYKTPVYLATYGIEFHLFVFDDEEIAEEWLSENKNVYNHMIRINDKEGCNNE